MNEDAINIVLDKIDALNKLMNENKESSSKVLVYLVGKTKEFEKSIMSLRNDINDIIEAENNSYNEIENLKAEMNKQKEIENLQTLKIKELETKLAKHQEANKKSESSFDKVNKTLFDSIDAMNNEHKAIKKEICNVSTKLETMSNEMQEKLFETKDYILIDRSKKQKTKFGLFIYKIFHYRQIKYLEKQKLEEQERQRQEEEKKHLEQLELEKQKVKENREKIKDILNSTKK